MKILLVIGLLFIASCASINDFVAKVDFEQRLEEGVEISQNLISNSKATKVEIVKAKNIEDFMSFFRDLGYVKYGISKFKFIREDGVQNEPGDYLFVHQTKESQFIERIS